jgi:hypothetical protein
VKVYEVLASIAGNITANKRANISRLVNCVACRHGRPIADSALSEQHLNYQPVLQCNLVLPSSANFGHYLQLVASVGRRRTPAYSDVCAYRQRNAYNRSATRNKGVYRAWMYSSSHHPRHQIEMCGQPDDITAVLQDKNPGTHCIADWMDLRNGSGEEVNRMPVWNQNSGSSSP